MEFSVWLVGCRPLPRRVEQPDTRFSYAAGLREVSLCTASLQRPILHGQAELHLFYSGLKKAGLLDNYEWITYCNPAPLVYSFLELTSTSN
jgi:hypothetical protein